MEENDAAQEIQYATLQQNLINAIRSHFTAKRDRAMANLNNYLNNPVGVGEHPDVVEECVKLIQDLSDADDVLDTLEGLLK
jgi:transcriptional/translational regulatory protein YebC/TACO1